MATTYTKTFPAGSRGEAAAVAYWQEISGDRNQMFSREFGRVISNEIEYHKDGTHVVVTVYAKNGGR